MNTNKNQVVVFLYSAVILFGANIYAQDRSNLRLFADQTVDGLKGMMQEGKKSLEKLIISGETSEIDQKMIKLRDVILIASERARRLSEWDLSKVEQEAEKTFDSTIEAIEDYLALVADDGSVHKAANKIRAAALDQARVFREKASAKSSPKYAELAKSMDNEANRVSEIWESIKSEREITVNGLKNLKEAKELYIDVKKAQGVSTAVKDLEEVKNDLARLSSSMENVQKAVQNTNPTN